MAKSESNLPQDYNSLLKIHLNVQKEYESTLQSLHETRKQLQVAEVLHLDYQEEIKVLQKERTKYVELETKYKQLQMENLNSKQSSADNLTSLEGELSRKDEKISELQKQLELVTTSGNHASDNHTSVGSSDDLELFVFKIEELQEQLDSARTTNLELETNNFHLKSANSNLQSELDSYRDSLESNRGMLNEANALIETLRSDNMNLQFELNALKSQPLDQVAKGNSLFAEVNDRRLHLEKKFVLMKQKFEEMKKEKVSRLTMIRELRWQNSSLCEKLKEEVKEKNNEYENAKVYYRDQLSVLKDCIESYKKQLAEKSQAAEQAEAGIDKWAYFDRLMKRKDAEIEEWKEKLSLRSLNNNLMSQDHTETKRKLRYLNAEMEEQKLLIANLKEQISDLEERNSAKESEAVPAVCELAKSILKNPPNSTLDATHLNFSILPEHSITLEDTKQVKFAEKTPPARMINENVTVRRGAKISISKRIFLPSSTN